MVKWILFLSLFVVAPPGVAQKEVTKAQQQHAIYACPMHPEETSHEPGKCPQCGMNLVKQEEPADTKEKKEAAKPADHDHQAQGEVYVCPMHPQIVRDQPGSCPVCGMDLVRKKKQTEPQVKANDSLATDHAGIQLSLQKQQLIGVQTANVVKKPLFKKVQAPGQIAFDPELYTAQTEYQEALRQLYRVKDSPLKSVRRNVQRMVESARIRLRVLGLSDAQIKAIRPSTYLSESLLLSRKSGKTWVYAEVFEVDLAYIEPGQSVQVTSSYLGGKVIPGKVVSTDEVINPKTRTAKVRIQIEDTSVKLRPQSYVEVSILVPQGEHLAVPESSIVDTGLETYAFVTKGDGYFEPRKVRVLLTAGGESAIAEGVSEGEKIVTSANFLLDSESRLKSALTRMTGQNH